MSTNANHSPWAARGAVAVVTLVVIALVVQIARLRDDSTTVTTSAGPPAEPPAPNLDASRTRPETYSNIYRYDYVGPEACGKCHAKNYESWRSHPHSKMNANATAASVVGDFSGVKLDYADGRVVFSKGLGDLTMTIYRQSKFVRQLKVTRSIGSRFVQMYAGVQTEGPEPPDDPVYKQELKLPFSYWIERNEWFPQTYDEMPNVPEYDEKGRLSAFYKFTTKARGNWKQVCVKCHNTYAYAARFAAAPGKKLVGFPAADISLDTKAPEDARVPELEPWELVTMGISCESCHFGGREHALNGASISFLPRGQDLTFSKATPELLATARHSPYVVNSICKQCHGAETTGPTYPDGGGHWNSREALDLASGACASKVACTSCHNPHEAGPVPGGGPDQKSHLQACVGCHERFRAPEAVAKHTSHAPSVTCLDCHMPRVVHGLSGMIRTHRISAPTDARMIKGEYPNACNMCHLGRSIGWTLDALEKKWGRKVDLGAGFQPSTEPMGTRWLAHTEPVVRQVAAAAYARSPLGKDALGQILPTLNDESPPTRMFNVIAVEKILGRPIGTDEYTPWAPAAVRREQMTKLAPR